MADTKIPLGVQVITIIMYIQAIVGIGFGIFFIIDKDQIAHELSEISDSEVLAFGIGMIVIAVITGLLAMGLRQGSAGVRIFVAVIMALHIAAAIYALIALPGARTTGLVQGLIALVVLYFLYGSDDSKEFFA